MNVPPGMFQVRVGCFGIHIGICTVRGVSALHETPASQEMGQPKKSAWGVAVDPKSSGISVISGIVRLHLESEARRQIDGASTERHSMPEKIAVRPAGDSRNSSRLVVHGQICRRS